MNKNKKLNHKNSHQLPAVQIKSKSKQRSGPAVVSDPNQQLMNSPLGSNDPSVSSV